MAALAVALIAMMVLGQPDYFEGGILLLFTGYAIGRISRR